MNPTAASLLGLLDTCGGELTGGELVRVAQTRIGDFWTLTRSQVYRELAKLESDGHIRPGTPGPRDSRPYRITGAGRTTYRRWLLDELPGETVRIPILLAVAFGAVLPADGMRDLLAAAHAEHAKRLARYRELYAELEAAGVDAYSLATLSFGIHHEEAVLRWFESLPPSVASPHG